jgi:hypothetical protein
MRTRPLPTAWMTRSRAVLERTPGDARELTAAWWTWGPHRDGELLLVSVTDFELRRLTDLLRVYCEGVRLRRAWPTLRGAVGMWMWTKPLRKRAGSVSVWREEADLARFLRSPCHLRVMSRFRDAGELESVAWQERGFEAREVWRTAARRLAARDPEPAQRGARR